MTAEMPGRTKKEEELASIDASIAHWYRIEEGVDSRIDGLCCALCIRHYYGRDTCDECPLNIYGMKCSDMGQRPSPWKEVKRNLSSGWTLPPPDYRSGKTQDAVKVMITALLLVREAVASEQE